ncbi:SDR family NAD(P)-dependent oxidoreductase [Candidatus Mycobacterium wuenschmannii]|uniref:SDR family NAD(P)-dependent oxidoreductase n=1 Tax=Candidatus Mycobacterium wuenschmannii TaxID=3027808 RepID=A0ABY8VX67_9MYCO|nr:type I polyketide synthase [Candidatus Mycobacterium wuenschmannii]WIM86738.1 SDR family NAD(P)-dependent oxidoreductase [Candidatus Mycobacterium wuenschmannii]
MTERTFLDLVRQRVETYRDKAAFDYCRYFADGEEHSQLTFGELDTRARATAAVLQRMGATGERVLVLCPSGLDFIVAFFGCIYAGAVAVPVHPPARAKVVGRVASIVQDTEARFAVATAETQAKFQTAIDEMADGSPMQWCAVDALATPDGDWTAPRIDPDDTAMLQYTSGSTGSPKGVEVSHRNLLSNVEAIRTAWGGGNDRAKGVFWLPLHHDMGLIGGVLTSIYVAATTYFMPPESFIERPMRWLEAITKHGGTITAAPNFAYQLCVDLSTPEERAALDLSTMATAMCGAEPIRAATLERFIDAFAPAGFPPEGFAPVYGMAESTLLISGKAEQQRTAPVVRCLDSDALRDHRVVAVAPDSPDAASFVACGQVQPNHEAVIVDPTTGRPCADDEVGEIWLAGGSIAKGYWGKPAETAETFGASLADTARGPFLRTGDLGFHLDGELFVSGRLKDLIVIRGRNHYPQDIESTVQDSHGALLRGRGAAFSITPDADSTEQLVVVQEVDRWRVGEIDTDQVLDAIRIAVAEQHEIRPYAIVLTEPSTIPTTSSGKIRRNRSRQRFLDGDIPAIAEWRATPTGTPRHASSDPAPPEVAPEAGELAAWLATQLSDLLDLSPGDIDTSLPFAHYGLDSVHAVRLTAALGEHVGQELSPTLPYEYPTIDALCGYLTGGAATEPASEPVEARAVSADEPIAIIGIGCRFPGADGPAAFWQLLTEGRDAVGDIPPERWTPDADSVGRGGFLDQVDQFDAKFFNISPREAARIDPQQRLLLEVAWEALEDAGQPTAPLAGTRTGVFVGVSTYDYGSLQFGRPDLIDAYSGTGGALSIAANRLSYALDLHGPSMAVDTACSSSLVAVHLACRSLRDGESTLAIVGGVNVILSPALGLNFSKATLMAADGRCKTFDAAADGYVRGEGAGAVILKPLSQALTDGDQIYAVLRGSATNHDGRTNGLTAPSRQAQEAVLAEAYQRAGLSPNSVQYVEAHGTGTALGDTIEANALGSILADGRTPDNPCLIGSVKTNIGHLEAAAGMAGLIKTALALHHREIPSSLNFDEPNPHIPFERLALKVVGTRTPWPLSRRAVAGVSSFGFGGTNAHVVMTEAPEVRAPQPHPAGSELLPLSARSPEALSALAARYEDALRSGLSLADLSYTAGAHRDHHEHRLAAVGRDAAEMAETLAAYRQGENRPGSAPGRRRSGPGAVFVFSGQGSQWQSMGRQLHTEEEVFRDTLAECDRAMRPHLNASVVDALLADDGLDDIGVIQPAIFAMQVALAALWRSWGVEPAAVIGHSMGEVAAAHVAGALNLDDAARVICARARLLRGAARGGAMVSAELSRAEADALIAGREDRVAVAASNSVRSTVLSGDSDVLSELMIEIERRMRFCRWVDVDVASHSPRMDALRADLSAALTSLRPTAATTPMYSTVIGEPVDGAGLDNSYWVANLCSPVSFSPTARQLLEQGHEVFLEISPHPVLLSALREDAEDLGRSCALVPSMRRDQGGRESVLASLGALYANGQPVAWDRLHPRGGRLVAAPTYPWQRERFWLDITEGSAQPVPEPSSWRGPIRSAAQPNTVVCEIDVSTALFPTLSDHRVQGAVVVPGATLLELAVAGTARAFGTPLRMPHDVTFHRSLVLDGVQPRTVQLTLRGEPSGPISFELQGMDPTAALLASGGMVVGETDGGVHDPGEVQTRCTEQISGEAFYSRLARHGLEYGPAFRVVTDVWRRDGEAIARLSPGDSGDFDAALLDGCFQVLAATLPATNGHSHDTYLPVGVADLRVRAMSPDGVWCHTRLRDGAESTVEGDVFLLDRSGSVLAEVHGLRLKRVGDSAPSAPAVVARDDLFVPRWEAADLAAAEHGSPGPGDWLIFGDAGAITDAARTLLEQRSQSGVLVEQGADFARLGPAHYRVDPTQPHHFRRVLDDLQAPLRGVLHLWGLSDSMEASRVVGPTSVLHLVQALTASQQSPRLWLVTQGAQPVEPGTDDMSVAQAPLWGMGRSINHEHPELRCSRIDLPVREQPADLSAFVDELLADTSGTEVAFRGGRRYVAGLAPLVVEPEVVQPTPGAAFRMEYLRPGVLDDIDTRTATRRLPDSNEVEIQVHATGLNFIDVMRALGVYPGQEEGPTQVGVECSGVVTAVGHDVDDIRVGDSVIALAAEGVGSYVTTLASLVTAKPVELSFEQAATIPIAYLTAYYALHEQARLRRGERVLVHSAAGGVGLAAVEVARWLNATVIATAGTPDKRNHLHSLGIQHVFDSRSTDFADQVLAVTGGAGVDAVLNSLSGDAIAHSLETLGPYGRFLEIGKADIYGEGRLRMWQLRNNASYFVIDLARLIVDRPGYVGGLLRDIVAHIEQGAFRPLPVRAFPAAETATALRTLSQGKQIGKIAIAVDTRVQPVASVGQRPTQFEADATYLITGGLGGLGLATASWMVERGARHLVLLGRGPASPTGQQAIDDLPANVVYARGDVTERDALASVLDSIRADMPPLRGVVHAAGILDDGILARLDDQRVRAVMAPKVDGAWNLHTLTRDADLDFFVLFSSAAGLLGSPGQAHYAAGNAFLDALAWHRRAEGRPALSIDWGPWAEVGLVNRPEQHRNLNRHGMIPLPVTDGLQTLGKLLRSSATQVGVLRMESGAGLPETPAETNGPSGRDDLQSYLRDQVAGKLGVAPSQLDIESPLQQLGVDSLVAVELRAQIERDLGIVVPVVRLLDGPSVTGLAGWLADQLGGTPAEPASVEAPDAPAVNGSNGSDPEWMDILGRLPDISDDDVDALLRDVLAAREGQDDG